MFLYSRSHHGQVPWRKKGWIAIDVCKCLFWFLFCCFCRRDVFACIGLPDGDTSWEHSFSRWPLGVCDYLVPVKRQFHPEEWVHRTRHIYNWSEPHNRCTRKHTKSLTSIDRCVFNQVKIISTSSILSEIKKCMISSPLNVKCSCIISHTFCHS